MSGGDSPTGKNKAGSLVTFILHPGVCLAFSWQLRAVGTPDAREGGTEAQVLWSWILSSSLAQPALGPQLGCTELPFLTPDS